MSTRQWESFQSVASDALSKPAVTPSQEAFAASTCMAKKSAVLLKGTLKRQDVEITLQVARHENAGH